jgi:hypothetical protein
MIIQNTTAISAFGCKRIGPAQAWIATGVITASFAGNFEFSSPKKITRRDNLRVIN